MEHPILFISVILEAIGLPVPHGPVGDTLLAKLVSPHMTYTWLVMIFLILMPKLTIGNDPTTAAAVGDMGAVHVDCAVSEAVIDAEHKMVTTPAYMLAGDIGEVFDGASVFVEKLLAL